MPKETIPTGQEPILEITRVSGDLVIRPWMSLDVEASGDYTLERKDDLLRFTAQGDLVLKVPARAAVSVGEANGDVVIKSISGAVDLGEISGDVVLSNLGAVRVGTVRGDLVARNLSGPLLVDTVQGDAVLRSIDGDTALESAAGDLVAHYINGSFTLTSGGGDLNLAAINGDVAIMNGRRDLNLREIGGLCIAKDIAGDIRLRGGLGQGEHILAAAGDIVVRWPTTQPVTFEIIAAEIENSLPLQDVVEDKSGFRGRLGDGGPHLGLSAGGKVILKEGRLVREKWDAEEFGAPGMDFMSDLSNLGERIGAEVAEKMSRAAAEMEANLVPKMEQWAEQFAPKMENWAEQFSQNAAAAAAAAAEKASAKARDAAQQDRARPAPPPPPPAPKAESTSVEEQLRILKMVEKGVITPEEASLLLEALDGSV